MRAFGKLLIQSLGGNLKSYNGGDYISSNINEKTFKPNMSCGSSIINILQQKIINGFTTKEKIINAVSKHYCCKYHQKEILKTFRSN